MTEGHGDDLYRYNGAIRHNFSTNICQNVDHAPLASFLATRAAAIASYPEPAPVSIEKKIAGINGIPAECVMVTNGATDAIYITAHMLQGRKSAILEPTFAEYEDGCTLYNHQIEYITSLEECPSDANAIWFCNPNNPTGYVHDKEKLASFIAAHPKTLFIIDQAYCSYTCRDTFSHSEAAAMNNAVVLFSLTKEFCIPGMRIGYAAGNAELLSALKEYRIPWSVNHLAIDAADYLLDHKEDYRIETQYLVDEASRVRSILNSNGIKVTPGETNFMLCELPSGKACDLKEYLALNHGILIRDAANFHGLTERHFRIAVQSPEQDNLLIEKVLEWMHISR